MRTVFLLPWVLLHAAACSSTTEGAAPVALSAASLNDSSPRAVPAPLSDEARAVFQHPSFERWFAESYLAVTEVEPRLTKRELESLQEIMGHLAADRTDEAMALAEKGRGPAGSAVFDFTVANLHIQQDQPERALEPLRTAVDKYPRFRRAWQSLGVVHFRAGDFPQASQALARVVQLGGDSALIYGMLGFSCSATENELSAETSYRMAIMLDPITLDWKRGLASSLFRQGRFGEVVALCDTLIAEHPDNAELWLLQATAYIGAGQHLKAAGNYELVDGLGRSSPESLSTLGDIYVNESLFDLAVGAYGKALDLNPLADPSRAVRAAKALAVRGAQEDCRELLDQIERVHAERLSDATRKDLLRLRARVALAEGASDEEVRVLKEIVALDPLDGDALVMLGQYAARNGDVEGAIFQYERAAAVEATEAVARMRHAQLLVGEGRYAEALPLLRRAQALDPSDNIQQFLAQVERIAQAR